MGGLGQFKLILHACRAAVIFLHIAVLLSFISALMKKEPVWILGLITGATGVFYFINGFIFFLK